MVLICAAPKKAYREQESVCRHSTPQNKEMSLRSCPVRVSDGLNSMFETAIRKVPTVRPMDVADVIGGAVCF